VPRTLCELLHCYLSFFKLKQKINAVKKNKKKAKTPTYEGYSKNPML